MRRESPEWIAEERFVLVHADGRRKPAIVRIGNPYVVDGRESRCPIEIEGFIGRGSDIAGSTTMQALALALSFAAQMLVGFVDDGGRVLYAGGEDGDESDVDFRATFGVGEFWDKVGRRHAAGASEG